MNIFNVLMQLFRLTIFLLLCSFLCIAIGFVISGLFGALVGFLFSIIVHTALVLASPTLCLSFGHAQRAHPEKDAELVQNVTVLASTFSLPVPKVYVSPDPQPNIFVVGLSSKRAHLVVTQGLLELVPENELQAFISFGLARTTREGFFEQTVMATYAGIITEMSQIGQFSILSQGNQQSKEGNSISALMFFLFAPIASFFIKFVVSRQSALQADFYAASITREPQALANMIEKSESAVAHNIPLINPNPSLAHLYAVHPLRHPALSTLFSLHPNSDIRIQKLRGMIL